MTVHDILMLPCPTNVNFRMLAGKVLECCVQRRAVRIALSIIIFLGIN